MDVLDTGSNLLPLAGHGDEGRAGTRRLRLFVERRQEWETRRHGVIDVDPLSTTYGQFVGQVDFPGNDNELHHFGWNACSACPLPAEPAPAYGASLPDRSGHWIVTDSHPGYESGSQPSRDTTWMPEVIPFGPSFSTPNR